MEKTTMVSNLMILVLVFVASLGTTNANTLRDLKNLKDISFRDIFSLRSVNANADIDRLLARLSRVLPDRVKVPDFGTKYNIQSCFVEGLSTGIVRAGDVSFNITLKKAAFSFGLAINDISINCLWHRKVLLVNLNGTAKGTTGKVGLLSAISINLRPGAHPVLDEFRVLSLEKIKTTLTGLGVLNKLAGTLSNVIINKSRDKIIEELEGNVARKLKKELEDLKIPRIF